MSEFKLNTNIELIDDEELTDEAFAAISLNPTFQWAKIVVTDDQPNANKHRVPLEEFDNIIKTGIFAPIKMTEAYISRGHEEAKGKPIGIITQLTKANNKIIALAALWKKERPDDINMLKELYAKGTPPNVSWELSYVESSLEDGEVEALHGISLNALVVVSAPAYTGRTPFVAMASSWTDEYISALPDSAFMHTKDGERFLPVKDDKGLYIVGNLQAVANATVVYKDGTKLPEDIAIQIKENAQNILNKIESAIMNISLEQDEKEDEEVETLEEYKTKVSELQSEVERLTKELDAGKTELAALQSYKDEIEKDKATAAKLSQIKQRFTEAGLEKDETFWNEKASTLVAMEDSTLDFMIQELVSFASKNAEASKPTGKGVPKITDNKNGKLSPVELAKALRERNLQSK